MSTKGILSALAFFALHAGALVPPSALLAQDALDVEAEDEGDDEFDEGLREPKLLLYVPFDGTAEAFTPVYADRSTTRVGTRPMEYGYGKGIAGQARTKGPSGYAGVSYPIEGNIELSEGTLSLWLRWDTVKDDLPPGSIISHDIFPLAAAHEVFASVRRDEKWHHLVLMWKRKEQAGTVFLDGKEALTVAMAAEWFRPPPRDEEGNPLPIRHDMLLAHQLPGSVDEVYIWDMELPEEDVRSAHERGRKGQTSWPKEILPERKPWRPLAGLLDLGDQRKRMIPVWSPDKAKREESGARVRLSLDGDWRCQPLGKTKYVPTSMVEDEGFLDRRTRIGQWRPCRGIWTRMGVPGTWKATSDIGAPPKWHGSPLADYYGAIIERDLDLPETWKGKGLFISIAGKPFKYGRIPCPISVIVNNRFAGESFGVDGKAVDITDLVTFGKENRVAMLLGYPTLPMEDTTLGRVTLEVRASRELAIDYAYVTPFDGPTRVDLIAEITRQVEGEKAVDLECAVWDWPDGKDRINLGRKQITVKSGGDPWYPVSFAFPDPHRWNPEDPHLYCLALRAYGTDGNLLDEGEPVRFGFRTLAVAGKDTLLNGKPFHMRGLSHNSPGPGEGGFAYKKSVGVNADRCLSSYLHRDTDRALEACDRAGWLQCYHVDFSPYWRNSDHPGERELFWGKMKHAWNHPSIVFWFAWGNGFVNGPHGHPRQIGGVAGVDHDADHERHRAVRAYCKAFHENAPGRLMFYYRLGVGGDARGIMHYMGWGTPIQAREEWPSYWHENCNEPFHGSEVSLIQFKYNYLWQWGRGHVKLPFSGSEAIVEHGARYFGDELYSMLTRDMAVTMDFTDHGQEIEGAEYLMLPDVNPDFLDAMPLGEAKEASGLDATPDLDAAIMADEGESETGIPLSTHADTTRAYAEKDATDAPQGRWDFDFEPVELYHTPIYWTLKNFVARRTLCSWRTYGIGYLIHVCFKRQSLMMRDGRTLNPTGRLVKRYNSALLLYIGGPPGDFVQKDHAFYSGEKVTRQIIVRNDHYSPAEVAAQWRVVDVGSGSRIAGGEATFTVDVGALHKEPITFTAPPTEEKRALRVIVSYTERGEKRQDESFDLQVFPRKPVLKPARAEVGVIDPVGDSSSMLEVAGQPFRKIGPGGTLEDLDLLILGRRSYTEETRRLIEELELKDAVSSGLNVIVFAQTARWVMGLQNEHTDSRRAFIRDRTTGLFDGLDNADLADWRGASKLIEAYPDWDRKADWTRGKYSKHGMLNEFGQGRFYHWSNKGMVCTYSYAKPQIGNFCILLDNGFDLLHTPLVEQRIGDGRILFCQLDVTDRYGADPPASLLVDRMLKEYSVKRPRPPHLSIGYLGGPQGRKIIGPLGLPVREVKQLGKGFEGLGLLIVSADEAAEELKATGAGIEEFLNGGGKLVLLPVTEQTPLGWLPVEVKRERGEAFITKNLSGSPLLRGLGLSDFFWRRSIRCLKVSSEAEGAFNADSGLLCSVPVGRGQVVVCQIDPSWFEWCWQQGKVGRVWSTLFRNLGASSRYSIDLLCADDSRFEQVYHVKTLPFDPDMQRVW